MPGALDVRNCSLNKRSSRNHYAVVQDKRERRLSINRIALARVLSGDRLL